MRDRPRERKQTDVELIGPAKPPGWVKGCSTAVGVLLLIAVVFAAGMGTQWLLDQPARDALEAAGAARQTIITAHHDLVGTAKRELRQALAYAEDSNYRYARETAAMAHKHLRLAAQIAEDRESAMRARAVGEVLQLLDEGSAGGYEEALARLRQLVGAPVMEPDSQEDSPLTAEGPMD